MFRLQAKILGVIGFCMCALVSHAATLSDIKFAELPGERAELRLKFDTPPASPTGYSIEQPARIVLDFADISNALEQKKFVMNVGVVTSAIVLEGGGRTRLIVNLDNSVPYRFYLDGNEYVVEIGVEPDDASPTFVSSESGSEPVVAAFGASQSGRKSLVSGIKNIDFRRGEIGEGKVIVSLTDSYIKIDIEEVSNGIEVRFLGADLPEELRRKLDVLDFATPVKMISSSQESDGVRIRIETTGEYDYLAYQADTEYVINIKPLTSKEIADKKNEFTYVGDRLSLNFQNIPVRNVLQLIADFTELNLVASDTVTGSITLRLDNVPWDQALDIILKTKGLDQRQIGNVLMVAPAAEIAERERQEIETKKQLQELAPLRTEYIRVRYANAGELFSLFLGSGDGGQSGGEGGSNGASSTGSLLSVRGQAIVDERTNSIILTDTEEKIEEFKRLIDKIDIPIRQVMIEARIVIANSDFRKELGSRIAGAGVETSNDGSKLYSSTGSLDGIYNGGNTPQDFFAGTGTLRQNEATLVDLGVFNRAGSVAFDIITSNFLLGLELSAMQQSGFAEIVSQPKVITGDKQKATIESGTEIPFQEESASGGTTTAFKDAVLKLEVTPQITPDNRVIMDLHITQDSISGIDQASGIPILDITQLETQVLVADGETIVLGGIYQTESTNSQTKIPLLGDIPFLGRLFRNNLKTEEKRELLIFITPRIMTSNFIE